MKFDIALTIDRKVQSKASIVHSVAKRIGVFFADKKYGVGINEFLVGVAIVNPSKGFEHLFKEYKPKLIPSKKSINEYTKEEILIEKQFHYSIRIDGDDFSKFTEASEIICREMVVSAIFSSLNAALPILSKIKSFEAVKFKNDCDQFLTEFK
ncbi:hypothetical protein [Arcticibacterium luteifluviistationis]|uniref:Uncharacterized protein n=1 Tax=Arcticibacterium luteifluviistationis TaxID=1784714 RepID=A0A2Z4G936_9BACT|nr:hypothetical protein [Arcticibacterium luteifluviistationis]AWV97654.1 hypothetical protein DJ013_05535 [Arcticibacterium luteifluviistationis]